MLRPCLLLSFSLVVATCDESVFTRASSRATIAPEPASSSSGAAPEGSAAPGNAAPAPVAYADDGLGWPAGYVPPLVWETRQVSIDGVDETWRLVWRKPPRFNGCAPWSSCACAGVEWGLEGELDLVRERPGAPVEKLDLSALREGGKAQIPGFALQKFDEGRYDAAGKKLQEPKSLEEVVKRAHAKVLDLRDYDHDGRATELVFQTGYLMCGSNPSVLVGVSKSVPRLHVLGAVESPAQPLVMNYLGAWDKIRSAPGKTVEVALQVCGDHGGGGYYMTLGFAPGGLHVVDAAAWGCDLSGPVARRTVRLPTPAP